MNLLALTTIVLATLVFSVQGKTFAGRSRENLILEADHHDDDDDGSCGADHPCVPHKECCGRVFGEAMCLKRPTRGEMCDPTAAMDSCPADSNFCDCPCEEGYECEEARDGTSVAGRPVGYCKKGGIHATIRNHTEILDGLLGRGEYGEEEEGHAETITL